MFPRWMTLLLRTGDWIVVTWMKGGVFKVRGNSMCKHHGIRESIAGMIVRKEGLEWEDQRFWVSKSFGLYSSHDLVAHDDINNAYWLSFLQMSPLMGGGVAGPSGLHALEDIKQDKDNVTTHLPKMGGTSALALLQKHWPVREGIDSSRGYSCGLKNMRALSSLALRCSYSHTSSY